jgi:predicted 3-demethylubiquinone-9 3-methyltransferase (glyoxalase superfamily)
MFAMKRMPYMTQRKITPCLWFDFNAEEAVQHYMGVFKNSKILEVSRYGDAMPELAGKVLLMRFELEGREFQALNAGPQLRLSEGGSQGRCGWLKDRFGLSWQIVPSEMASLLGGPDAAASARAMQAMMTMSKLDIAALRKARNAV